jgi:energy-coupling factor transporter ATP-binding protein EcfA2
MNNNDIFKKLRVALQLRDDQIIEIVNLVNFRISKGELADIFRSEDHPNYMECGDQLLRNFLNGLIIHLRGTKEEPKNPKEVLSEIAKNKTSLFKEDKKPDFKKEGKKKPFKPKATGAKKPFGKGKPADKKQKPENPVERFKFNSGKGKK